MIYLYATIWLAMALFAAGEVGRTRLADDGRAPVWAWPAFATGLALAILHTLLAFAVVHQWSHDDAVTTTAAQTAAIYGVAFGGGVYVNYVFLGAWLADTWWWGRDNLTRRPGVVTWSLRFFYLVILFNAAVVFVPGLRRTAGLILVGVLLWAWWPRDRIASRRSATKGYPCEPFDERS